MRGPGGDQRRDGKNSAGREHDELFERWSGVLNEANGGIDSAAGCFSWYRVRTKACHAGCDPCVLCTAICTLSDETRLFT